MRQQTGAEGQPSPSSTEGEARESQTKAEEGRNTEAPEKPTVRAGEELISQFTFEGENHVVKMLKMGTEFVCEMCSGCGKLLEAIDNALKPESGLSVGAQTELAQLRQSVNQINSSWNTDPLATREQNARNLDAQIQSLRNQQPSVIASLVNELRAVEALMRRGGYRVNLPRERSRGFHTEMRRVDATACCEGNKRSAQKSC